MRELTPEEVRLFDLDEGSNGSPCWETPFASFKIWLWNSK